MSEARCLTRIKEGPVRDFLPSDGGRYVECAIADLLGPGQRDNVCVEVRVLG